MSTPERDSGEPPLPDSGQSPLHGTGGTGRSAYSDCSDVLGRVFFFLDNELDRASCEQIQEHLDECGPCLARYDLERTVKSLVARSCSERAPEGLRERVKLSIRQVQVQISHSSVDTVQARSEDR